MRQKNKPRGRPANRLLADRPDHNGSPTLARRRRVLSWYDHAERVRYLQRCITKRRTGEHMKVPLMEHPCLLCGTTVWERRMDIWGGVCDSCRPEKNRRKNQAQKKHAYWQDPEKYRSRTRAYRRDHPEAQRQTDRRAHHAKQQGPMREYRDRRTYLRERYAHRSDWDMVVHRAVGRQIALRTRDIRRYACAFRGEHHRNRRIDAIVPHSGRNKRERTP